MNAFHKFLREVDQFDDHKRRQLAVQWSLLNTKERVYRFFESRFRSDTTCPHCNMGSAHLQGHASGLRRYRYCTCKRTFNVLIGILFAKLHK